MNRQASTLAMVCPDRAAAELVATDIGS